MNVYWNSDIYDFLRKKYNVHDVEATFSYGGESEFTFKTNESGFIELLKDVVPFHYPPRDGLNVESVCTFDELME